jgi:hypothetical protein
MTPRASRRAGAHPTSNQSIVTTLADKLQVAVVD